jgi:hypothetical protein
VAKKMNIWSKSGIKDINVVIKELTELSKKAIENEDSLSLSDLARKLRKRFPSLPPSPGPKNLAQDGLRLAIYRIVKDENIWFGDPDKNPPKASRKS